MIFDKDGKDPGSKPNPDCNYVEKKQEETTFRTQIYLSTYESNSREPSMEVTLELSPDWGEGPVLSHHAS